MNFILIWIVAYLLPGLFTGFILFLFRVNRNMSLMIIHVFLVVSIVLSFYSIHALGLVFPGFHDPLALLVYGASVLISMMMIGKIGMFYGFSSFVQELTMLLMLFLLSSYFPYWIAYLMVVPLYVLAHNLKSSYRYGIILTLSLWGVCILYLFLSGVDIFYLSAIHTIIGSLLIKKSMIYRW